MSNKRNRGQYDPDNASPYELSRSRIENFVRCPACFYMQQVEGIKFPSIPGYNINEATDVLLKKDFDGYRGRASHPFLRHMGLKHLIPYQHPDFEKWTQSLHFGCEGRMNTIHQPTNLKVGGGLDDIWVNNITNQLHIVDYKSTSQKTKGKVISLDDPWKQGYKRQMDLYVWIMRRMGFDVSDIGYFLYCDADRFSGMDFLGVDDALMRFEVSLINYRVDLTWIDATLFSIKDCLNSNLRPEHSSQCEYGKFLNHACG